MLKPARLIIVLIIFISVFSSCFSRRENRSFRKVLIVGIDGADWRTIDRLIQQGELKTFNRLINNGVRAPINTLFPTLSPNIWTTIATGKLPSEHGVQFTVTTPLEFAPVKASNNASSIPETNQGMNFFQTNSRRVRAFWNIATERRIPVISVGWMVSDPIEQIYGIETGFNLDEDGFPAVFPANLRSEVTNLINPKQDLVSTTFGENVKTILNRGNKLQKSLYRVMQRGIYRDKLFFLIGKHFCSRNPWKLSGIYSRLIDITQHLFYQYSINGSKIQKTEFNKAFKNMIDDSYRFADKQLSQILSLVDSQTLLIVLSDHGISAVKGHPYLIDINKLLSDWQLQSKETSPAGNIYCETMHRISEKRTIIVKLPENMDDEEISNLSNKWKKIILSKFIISTIKKPLFVNCNSSIFKNKITLHLELNPNLKTEQTISIGKLQWKVGQFLSNYKLTPFEFSGVHLARPQGVFLASGFGVKTNIRIKAVHVLDILPTVLAYLGLPVAKDMPGKIRKDIFNISLSPISTIPTYEKTPYKGKIAPNANLQKSDKGQWEELKVLGYVS